VQTQRTTGAPGTDSHTGIPGKAALTGCGNQVGKPRQNGKDLREGMCNLQKALGKALQGGGGSCGQPCRTGPLEDSLPVRIQHLVQNRDS
jgi:hypothetical protein